MSGIAPPPVIAPGARRAAAAGARARDRGAGAPSAGRGRVETPSASISRRRRSRAGPDCGTDRRAARAPTVPRSRSPASLAAIATICWARISSGFSGIVRRSSSPASTARTAAVLCTSSSRVSGKRMPFGTAPSEWPERPTRCSSVAIERGAPRWQTRSTWPTSMPSSSEAVATTTGTAPDLSPASASRRISRDMLP